MLPRRSSETNLFVIAFPNMRGTIMWGAIIRFVSLKLDFENKAARDWISVYFTSPRGQLALGSRIKLESRISLKFGKFGLMFIRQFLGTSYHSFQRLFKEYLKSFSYRFDRVFELHWTKEKPRAKRVQTDFVDMDLQLNSHLSMLFYQKKYLVPVT